MSFTILNGHIRDLKIVIHDKCPALPGQVAPPLIKTDSFPPIEIKGGMFHGLFRSRTSNADHANLHGRVEAREVTGRLEDTGTNREGVHCFGSVTFTAHPV